MGYEVPRLYISIGSISKLDLRRFCYFPNIFTIDTRMIHFWKGIYTKGIMLYEYSQSTILHVPHFRRVLNSNLLNDVFCSVRSDFITLLLSLLNSQNYMGREIPYQH